MQLAGLHHLTAVTGDPRANFLFYTRTLGLRLVKKTVNQDDTSSYHLFYADGIGSPGSDITFFHWPSRPEQRGTGSIVQTGFRLGSQASLQFWEKRLTELKVAHDKITMRNSRPVLDFQDPEGQRLSFIVDEVASEAHPWGRSPVPAEHQIRGLGAVNLSVPNLSQTEFVLTKVLGFSLSGGYVSQSTVDASAEVETKVYSCAAGAAGEVHVKIEPDASPARLGTGGVHHLAFRVPTFEQYDQWNNYLRTMRVPSSGPVDRFYFRSLYLREPNGILFELATDGPGFDADEPLAHMGEKLSLPPFLEDKRAQIEARLTPVDTLS